MKHLCYLTITITLILFAACSNTPAPSSKPAATDSITVKTEPKPIADTAAAKIGPTKLDTLAYAIFLALKNKSNNAYMKLAPTPVEVEQIYLTTMVPREKRELVKQRMEEEGFAKKAHSMLLESFQRAIQRGNELKISWNTIIYKGVKIDSIADTGQKKYKGELSFNEGKRIFHIKYDDCFRINNKYVITNIYTPYEDLSYLNEEKSLKYKAAYIRNCIAMMKTYPDMMRDSKLSPEQYCSCSYEQLSKETSCEELLKDTVHMSTRSGTCPQ